jgi:hypothetical protein
MKNVPNSFEGQGPGPPETRKAPKSTSTLGPILDQFLIEKISELFSRLYLRIGEMNIIESGVPKTLLVFIADRLRLSLAGF